MIKKNLIIPYKIKEKGWALAWWSTVHPAHARPSSILIIKKVNKHMKIRHTHGSNPWMFLPHTSEKRTGEMPVRAHSSLPPDIAPSTQEGTMWHSLGNKRMQEQTVLMAHRPIASVPRVQLFKDLWVNLLNTDLFSSTVFIIIFSIHMRELLDILRDDYTETLDMPVPARASHCVKYFFPGDEKSLSSITIRQ